MTLKILLNALELLIDEKSIVDSLDMYTHTEYDEYTNVLVEIIESAYLMADMKNIEYKITERLRFDISSFEAGTKLIKEANPQPLSFTIIDKTIEINPAEIIQEIQHFIEKIKDKSIDRMDALVSLEFSYDSKFDYLMMTFDSDNIIFDSIRKLLIQKLSEINNNEIFLLWARIKSSFANDKKEHGFPIYSDIIPEDFFLSSSPTSDLKDKCALIIAKYKPLTLKKMISNGFVSSPLILPGIVRVLSNTKASDMSKISSLEVLLMRSLCQIIALSNKITSKNPSEFAKAIGADPNGLIFDGEFLQEYLKNISKCKEPHKLLLLNVKRFIEYMNLFTTKQILIECALRQYKMGQEIISPRRQAEFEQIKSLEIYLQKDICKFLLEKNILAFGKSIGRNQIDLYHKEISGEDFVIEVKIYRDKDSVTLESLKKNFVQLLSYMDHHDQPRGILTIFNFTETLMMAPKKWLQGRVYIIVVNICDITASSRDSFIEVVESDYGIIDLIVIAKAKH